jgi:hypothetical protein
VLAHQNLAVLAVRGLQVLSQAQLLLMRVVVVAVLI